MRFHIDPSSGTPIYRQIADQVRHAIAGGTLRSGDRLPPVRDLAAELAVNPNTIAKAYQDLERDGLVETSRGRGTFVSQGAIKAADPERLRQIDPLMDRLIAEAYLLRIPDDELKRMLDARLSDRRRTRRDE
jgi:GntR family transcriptional regulator